MVIVTIIEPIIGELVSTFDVKGLVKEIDFITGTIEILDEIQAPIELLPVITGVIKEVDVIQGEIDSVIVVVAPEDETIDSFTTGTTVFEIGATVATPAFTATYSAVPDLAVLTDTEGTPAKDVTSTPNAFSSDGTFQKTTNNGAVTFTLTADFPVNQAVANRAISWRPRTYWGIGGAALLTEAQVEALGNDQLDNNFAAVFSPDAPGDTDYVWYCFPQSYDPGDGAQFQVGLFVGGWVKVGVVSITNANGVTQDYACWRTDFPKLGSFTVTVF